MIEKHSISKSISYEVEKFIEKGLFDGNKIKVPPQSRNVHENSKKPKN